MLFTEKIKRREIKVAVLGLGYVGLPLAVQFAKAGFTVFGLDLSETKIGQLRQGVSYIRDIPSRLVQEAVGSGKLLPTTDCAVLREADAVSICVPTPIKHNQEPDLRYIQASANMIKAHLHRGMAIILESTSYPGTTDEFLGKPFAEAGFQAGRDYYLCFSPERIDPGNTKHRLDNTPKVLGGATAVCAAVGKALYETIVCRVVTVSSLKAAEMTKLLENTFRSVNIGFMNEMARLSEELGIDIWEVVEAASTKPFGFMPFLPGPGIGGHCIPLDPLYLSWKAKKANFYSQYIALSQKINRSMPRHVVGKMIELLNKQGKPLAGSRLLLLGMAYKPDIDDMRESPNQEVFELLAGQGAVIDYHDYYIPSFRDSAGQVIRSVRKLTGRTIARYDCVVILTVHRRYDIPFVVKHARAVLDCRNATRGLPGDHIMKIGSTQGGMRHGDAP